MQKIIIKVDIEEEIKLTKEVECYILSSKLSKKFIQDFSERVFAQNKIVLSDDINICKELKLDGVIIDLSDSDNIKKDFMSAKNSLSKDAVIGVISRNRRHEAMLISELEPDFIIFRVWPEGAEKIKELMSWYNEFFLIQSAIFPQNNINTADFRSDIVILEQKYLAK